MPDLNTCSIDGCDNVVHNSRGWCCGHYKRWHRTGDPLPKPKTVKLCEFPGCDKRHASHGWCAAHYKQERLGQELRPLGPRNLSIEERFWAKVEKAPGCWGWSGCVDNGYARMGGEGVERWGHRLSWKLHNGPIPDGMYVDHLCHTKACTNPAHLQLTTPKQNNEHRRGPQRNSTTGILGVYFHKPRKKWTASITHNYQSHYLGLFDTPEEAEQAVIAKRNELFTHNDRDRAD